MGLTDVWWIIREKRGWLADCKEAGFSDEDLDVLERLEDAYCDVDVRVHGFKEPVEARIAMSEFKAARYRMFPELAKERVSDAEIARANTVALHRVMGLNYGERVPCPFHHGTDKNFRVDSFGYCYVCGEHCSSIRWLTKVCGMKFPEAVRKLNGMV